MSTVFRSRFAVTARAALALAFSAALSACSVAPVPEPPVDAPEHGTDPVEAVVLARGSQRRMDPDRGLPEGTLTTTGELGPFRTGVERIVRRTPVPVVPMALRGLWGSFFSRKDGAAMRKRPRRLRSRIELVCGMPVPPEDVTAARLETQILALRGAAC